MHYFYTLTYDRGGDVTGSAWDLDACERANGRNNAIPDRVKSYFSPDRTRITLGSGSYNARESGWTPETLAMVADLYFASAATPIDRGRVYAVRAADGRLLQMSQAELDAYVASRSRPATGTDTP